MKPETVAVFTPDGKAEDLQGKLRVGSFRGVQEFQASGFQPDLCLVHRFENPGALSRLLLALRSERNTGLLPMFSTQQADGAEAQLLDQTVSGLDQAAGFAEAILNRLSQLPGEQIRDSQNLRLLAFLATRPHRELEPYGQWRIWQVYSFPLASALADPGTDIRPWLERLTDRGLLERSTLVDRIRHCPHCSSAHHNFIDVCPECHDLDILRKPFIHCFTCGHIAPEDSFLTDVGLKCPNCGARLRHIGADYDRPLESYVCSEGHAFVEPEVQARCLNCGARSSPDRLEPKQIWAYRLSEEGRLAARTGDIRDLYASLERLNYVRPEYFRSMVQWLLDLCQRHDEESFSILGIRLINVHQLIEEVGRNSTLQVLDEFASRIRELIRATDLCTRTEEQHIWILLPKTPCPQCTVIAQRITELREQFSQTYASGLDFRVATFSAPAEMQARERAESVMARIAAQL